MDFVAPRAVISSRRGHLPALDGVRGLAILMVILCHVFSSNSAAHGWISRAVGTTLAYGIFGVDLFFVLSGFLITGILVDSVADEGFFRKFYARRVLRIFPLYYGVLAVLFLLTPLLHLHWNGMGWLLLGYLQNLRPQEIGSYSPGHGVGLNHFWSLAIEEQFYMVWPAVVFWVRDRRTLLWVTLGISAFALALRLGLVGVGVSHLPIHVTTITRADSLLLGGALALLCRSRIGARVVPVAPAGAVAAGAVLLVSILLLPPEFAVNPFTRGMRFWTDGLRYTVLALGSCCLIAWSLTPGSVCDRVFSWGWLRFFGKYSYGLYVLHMIPLSGLLRVLRGAIAQATHSKMQGVVGAGICSLGLAVVAAYASFHLYEKPFLRLKRLFDYAPERVGHGAGWSQVRQQEADDLLESESYKSRVSFR